MVGHASGRKRNIPHHHIAETNIHGMFRPLQVFLLAQSFIEFQKALEGCPCTFLVLASGIQRAAPIASVHLQMAVGIKRGGLFCRLAERALLEQARSDGKRSNIEPFIGGNRVPAVRQNAVAHTTARRLQKVFPLAGFILSAFTGTFDGFGKIVHGLTAGNWVTTTLPFAVGIDYGEKSVLRVHLAGAQKIEAALYLVGDGVIGQALAKHLKIIAGRVGLATPSHGNRLARTHVIHVVAHSFAAKFHPTAFGEAILALHNLIKGGEAVGIIRAEAVQTGIDGALETCTTTRNRICLQHKFLLYDLTGFHVNVSVSICHWRLLQCLGNAVAAVIADGATVKHQHACIRLRLHAHGPPLILPACATDRTWRSVQSHSITAGIVLKHGKWHGIAVFLKDGQFALCS